MLFTSFCSLGQDNPPTEEQAGSASAAEFVSAAATPKEIKAALEFLNPPQGGTAALPARLYDESLFRPDTHALIRLASATVRAELAFDPLEAFRGPRVVLPSGTKLVAFEVEFPPLNVPAELSAYCVDGGLINGRASVTARPDKENRRVRFVADLTHGPGLCRVVLALSSPVGEQLAEVNIWVGPTHDPLPEPDGLTPPPAKPNRASPPVPAGAVTGEAP